MSSDSDGSNSVEPDESYGGDDEVTIRKLSNISASGDKHCLYHFVAGKLTDEDGAEEGSTIIETTRVVNSELCSFISERCIEDLQTSGASSDKIGTFLSEGPAFIVTDMLPKFDHLSSSVPSITPKILTNVKTGRQTFEYIHPVVKDISIRIHEPRSPPKAEYSGGKKTVTSSMEKPKVGISVVRGHYQLTNIAQPMPLIQLL